MYLIYIYIYIYIIKHAIIPINILQYVYYIRILYTYIKTYLKTSNGQTDEKAIFLWIIMNLKSNISNLVPSLYISWMQK